MSIRLRHLAFALLGGAMTVAGQESGRAERFMAVYENDRHFQERYVVMSESNSLQRAREVRAEAALLAKGMVGSRQSIKSLD